MSPPEPHDDDDDDVDMLASLLSSTTTMATGTVPVTNCATRRVTRLKRYHLCLWAAALFVFLSLEADSILFPPEPPEDSVTKETSPHTPTKVPSSPAKSPTKPPTLPPVPAPVPAVATKPPTTDGRSDDDFRTDPTQPTIAPVRVPVATKPIAPSEFILPNSTMSGSSMVPLTSLPEETQQFVKDNCDLNPLTEWYPNNKTNNEWQMRAPFAILAGAWNSGVNRLARALQTHPQVLADSAVARAHGFFLPKNFRQTGAGGTKVYAARQRLYAQVYKTKPLKESPHMVALDISPGLSYYASQTSLSIQCVSPWAKAVILLRDPVERLYQQWSYGQTHLHSTTDFEDWLAKDMKVLETAGLLSSGTDPEPNNGEGDSTEQAAWDRYRSTRGVPGAFGRSMYVLQLQEWCDTLIAAGKNPKDEIFLLSFEAWEAQPQVEYQRLIEFMGLAPHTLDLSATTPQDASSLPPMKRKTRKMLHKFFEPYNDRLLEFLKKYGFDDKVVWRDDLWGKA